MDIKENRERKKRFLKRYRKNHNCIKRLKEKIEEIESNLQRITNKLSDMPRGGPPVTKEDLVNDKLETQERINKLMIKGKRIRKEILDVIDTLDDTKYIEILEYIFIDFYTFEDIYNLGLTKNESVRHIIRLYGEAIDKLEL